MSEGSLRRLINIAQEMPSEKIYGDKAAVKLCTTEEMHDQEGTDKLQQDRDKDSAPHVVEPCRLEQRPRAKDFDFQPRN